MITLYSIDPHSTMYAPFLFREINTSGRLVVRDMYLGFSCAICGKINEEKALKHGLPIGVEINSKRPYVHSAEFVHMVDARTKKIFGEMFGDKILFYEISSSGFWVAMAAKNIVPNEGDSGYRFLRKCLGCGRYRELLWDREVANPLLDSREDFVSIRLEGTYGALDSWYVSQEHAECLESISPPLTSLVVKSKLFTDPI